MAKALDTKTMRQVAIKRLVNFDHHEYHSLQLLREVKLMKEFQKQPGGTKYVPIIYDVIGAYEGSDESNGGSKQTMIVYVVMEYFPTDLKKLIESDLRYLSHKKILKIMHQALKAMNFIH